MVEQIIFRCIECGHYFRSIDRDVYVEEEYFCDGCSAVLGARIINNSSALPRVSSEDAAVDQCAQCGEDVRKRIIAVCPKCQTRKVKIQGTIAR
jgi:predicted  nucleic acid-binding Zn-ribbon protein